MELFPERQDFLLEGGDEIEDWGESMGYAKRMWMEEQARGYHTSSDAVCASCFDDPGLTAFIEDHLEENTCSICGQTSNEKIAASADELLQFFLDKVYEHYEDAANTAPWDGEEGGYMVTTYSMHEILFMEYPDIAPYETLKWLDSRLKDDVVLCDRDWQIMTPGQALESGWGRLAESVKHTTRFLFFPKAKQEEDDGEPFRVRPEEMLEQLGDVIHECGLVRSLPAGTKVFRARGHEAGTTYTLPKELGPPPIESAKTAGRMNAPGIVVFYGAYEKDTVVAEATGNHTAFSVAGFRYDD